MNESDADFSPSFAHHGCEMFHVNETSLNLMND